MNLTSTQKQWLAWGILAVVLTALTIGLGVTYPVPPAPSDGLVGVAGTTHISGLNVTGNTDLDGTLNVDGATTMAAVTVDDTLSTDDTDSTITGTQTLTPTATYYQFNPTSVLTLTLATGGAEDGDLLILHNINASYNVVVVDTGATVGGGNVTVGNNDLALFIYGNTKWIEISSPDNS